MERYKGHKLHEEDMYSATPSVFNANATLLFFEKNFLVANVASAPPCPIHPASCSLLDPCQVCVGNPNDL